MKAFTSVFFLLFCSFLFSQKAYKLYEHQNVWMVYIGDHKFSERFGVRMEIQWRRHELFNEAQQILLRGGLNYHLNDKSHLTAGYCFVETYPYGGLPAKEPFIEHRIWEQLQHKRMTGKVEWIHRIRTEQRMVGVAATYSNRFRYALRLSVPFKGDAIVDKSLYYTLSEEFFLGFSKDIVQAFDQNRLYAGVGIKIPKVGRLELGYLNQFILKRGNNIENNHTFQLSLSSTVAFR